MTGVIDCQTHWYPEEYFEWMTRRSTFPYAERRGSGYVYHYSPALSFPIDSAFCDIDQQLEDMTIHGVGASVSSSGSITTDRLPLEDARALTKLVNESRSEMQAVHHGRFYGLAALPLQDPPAALEALEYAVTDLGLKGVCLPANVNGELVSAPTYHGIFQRCAELRVPVFLHPTTSILSDAIANTLLETTVGYVCDTALVALDLVLSGLIEAEPGLVVVHPHLGGFVPFLSGRIDYEYRRVRGASSGAPPSEYLSRFFTDTVCGGNASAVAMAAEFYGPTRILVGTDYPFYPRRDGLGFLAEAIDADQLPCVHHGNASGLLGIQDQLGGSAASNHGPSQ